MLPQPREESSSVAQWQSPDKVGINRLPLAAGASVRKIYARPSEEIRNTFQRSSVVERSAVNRLVVGSNPTAGAKSQCKGTPLETNVVTVRVDLLSLLKINRWRSARSSDDCSLTNLPSTLCLPA